MTALYINEMRDYDVFVEAFNTFTDFINDHELKVDEYNNKREMLRFMEESTNEVDYFLESENKGFFEKIGEKVISILKSFNEAMEKLMEKIKGLFHKKTTSEIAAEAMNKNPKLAQSFLDGIANGSIKYSDYKDIDAMINSAEKIANDVYNNKIGVEDAEKKFQKTMETFNSNLRPVRDFLENVAGITAATLSIMGIKNAIMKLTVESTKNRKKINNIKFHILNEYADDPKEADKQRTVTSWKMKILQRSVSEHSKIMSLLYGMAAKITNFDISGGNRRKTINDLKPSENKKITGYYSQLDADTDFENVRKY